MAHLKRQKVPKKWPIGRKGNKYVVRGNSSIEKGIPVLIILRDMLKITQTRKEAKRVIREEKVLLNGKRIKDEKNTAELFDIITIVPAKGNYKVWLTDMGKFTLEKIKDNEAGYKISKIINKRLVKGGKLQLNLYDGRNIISKDKKKINDSLVIDLKNRKIERDLPLKEKAKVLVFGGKHSGAKGSIEKIDEKNKSVSLKVNDKKINVLIKHLMVTG